MTTTETKNRPVREIFYVIDGERGRKARPELTNWLPDTHKRTNQERHAALGNDSDAARSGLIPSAFSDTLSADQM